SENFYDNGASITRYDIAKHQAERAQLEFEQARDQQLLKIAQAYLTWAQSLRDLEVEKSKYSLLRRQFGVLEAQYKQGLKTKRDVLRIQTEISRLDIDVL